MYDFTNYVSKVLQLAQTASLPDLLIFDGPLVPLLASTDTIKPIDSYLKSWSQQGQYFRQCHRQ